MRRVLERSWQPVRRLVELLDAPLLVYVPAGTVSGGLMRRAMTAEWPNHIPAIAHGGALVLCSSGKTFTGKHCQALRTNSNRARRDGISTARLAAAEEVVAVFDGLAEQMDFSTWAKSLAAVRSELRATMESGGAHAHVAYCSDGKPIALTVALQDGDMAWVAATLATGESSDARYLLQVVLAESLAGQGCRHLLTNSMLGRGGGTEYLLRRLGFKPANVLVLVSTLERGRVLFTERPVQFVAAFKRRFAVTIQEGPPPAARDAVDLGAAGGAAV